LKDSSLSHFIFNGAYFKVNLICLYINSNNMLLTSYSLEILYWQICKSLYRTGRTIYFYRKEFRGINRRGTISISKH